MNVTRNERLAQAHTCVFLSKPCAAVKARACVLERSQTKSSLSQRVRLPLKPVVPISRAALLSLWGSCYRQNMVPLCSVALPACSGSSALMDWANEQAEVRINGRPMNRVKEWKTSA